MNFKKKILSSLIVSVAALVGSFIIPFIPCKIAPSVPNPSYQWTLCNLNPDTYQSLNSIKEYWGYTPSLTDAYFITLLLVFFISLLFLHYFARKKHLKE